MARMRGSVRCSTADRQPSTRAPSFGGLCLVLRVPSNNLSTRSMMAQTTEWTSVWPARRNREKVYIPAVAESQAFGNSPRLGCIAACKNFNDFFLPFTCSMCTRLHKQPRTLLALCGGLAIIGGNALRCAFRSLAGSV